ncbi:MAG: heme exporter protein CcmB [Actinomycetota bacterium]|nr:heme exporter protein CcmB [Actinomycetota bacterium]
MSPWDEDHQPQGRLLPQALAVAGKDLRVEWSSKVVTVRVLPFAGVLVLLFAVALDPDRGLLPRVGPGLFWLAVLLSALLAIGRAFAVERHNAAGAGLLLSGLDPAAMYLGKAAALVAQLLVLEATVGIAMTVMYDLTARDPWLLVFGALLATVGIAAAGTLYGALVVNDQGRDSLLALLLLPVLLPVLLAATRIFEAATQGATGGDTAWLGLLAVFAALYSGLGMLTFGSLIEEG